MVKCVNFKTWFNEITMGSDGLRDNTPAQTNQATDTAADTILKDPRFSTFNNDLLNTKGSPSLQRDKLIKFTNDSLKFVPKPITSVTSPPNVAFQMGQKMGLKPNPVPKPKI